MQLQISKMFGVLISLLGSLICTAQPISKIQNRDTLYHLYTLNAAQLLYLQEAKPNLDTAWLFTNSYKKLSAPFMQQLDSVDFGTYLQASISENIVSYTVVEKLPFTLSTKKIDGDILIYLKNNNSKNFTNRDVIVNATVYFGNKILPYDSGYGAYVTNLETLHNKDLQKKYFAITYKDKHYLQLTNITPEPIIRKQKTRKTHSSHALGYCISDKPIYKLGDSMHFKAYLVDNEKGKPINGKATIYIQDAQTNKTVLTKVLNAVTPGAYLFDWLLPDTLLQDRNYTITIGYKKNGIFVSKIHTIRLESYILNKNVITINPTKRYYTAGENIAIKVNTSDANGFPLGEVRLQYTVSLTDIAAIDKDTLLLTQAMRTQFKIVDTILPYEKMHDFIIDYKTLPLANMNLHFVGTAIDAQFEKVNFDFTVSYNTLKNETKFYQKADTVYINHLYLARDTQKTFILKCYDAMQKLVDSIKIVSPYKYKLKTNITGAFLYADNTLVNNINIFYNVLDIMQVVGEREAKQIKISFKYPFADGVHYRIKKGNMLMQKGFTTNLNFVLPDSTLENYSILLSNNMSGNIENNFYKLSFYALNKKVNITNTIPADAFPGQTIPIEFTATDWQGNPVANFNIASYAVNSMFQDRLSEPFIDVPDSLKRSSNTENISGVYNYITTYPLSINTQHFITKEHIVRYNLFKNEYYQLLFPKQGYQLVKNKKQRATPELAIFVSYKGVLYTPKYCMLDSNLISIGKINTVSKYSFAVDSGLHTVAIRAFDRYITIADVYINSFTKHYVTVNLDSIKSGAYANKLKVSDTLSFIKPSVFEKEKLENSLLLTYGLNVDSFMQIGNTVYSKKQFSYFNNSFESIQIDNDYVNVMAPINNSSALLQNKNNNYNLQTGRVINYYDYNSKTFNSKILDKKSVIDLHFQENIMPYNYLPFLLEPDTIPTPKYVESNEIKRYDNNPKTYFNCNNYYFNSPARADSFFQIQIFQGRKQQINNVWVINSDAMEQSLFMYYTQNNNLLTTYNASTPVDIYFFTAAGKLRILKEIRIPANAILYVNADTLQTDTLNEKDLGKALEIFNTITRIPIVPFYYEPSQSNDLVLNKTSYANSVGNAYLKGNVSNSSLAPLQETYILLEQGGKFKAGAITNYKGEFEFLKLNPGIYDIKIYNASYTLKYYYQVQVGGAFGQYFSCIMQERVGQLPDFESITNNYRLTTYEQKSKSNITVNVYDYRTRQLIADCKMEWLFGNGIEQVAPFTNSTITYTNNGTAYRLRISKTGYKTFDLSGIQFDLQNKTLVDVFLNLQSKNGVTTDYFEINNNWRASQQTDANCIKGYVTDENGNPLEFATLKIKGSNVGAKTDANGMYKLNGVKPGTYTVVVYYVGYNTEEVSGIKISATEGAIVNFKLERGGGKSLKGVAIKSAKRPAMMDESKAESQPRMAAAPDVSSYSVNTTVLSATALRPGNYVQKNGAPISLGGARDGNTQVMIDGVMIKSELQDSDGFSQTDSTLFDKDELGYLQQNASKQESEKMNNLFTNIINSGNGSQYRKTFADVAYWQPNLITDAQGKTYTTIKLPDNITQWQSYTVGMGKSFMYGQTSQKLKVYKPMQTITYAPSFLHQGDQLFVKAKFTNLLDDAKKCELFFTVNGKSLKKYSVDLQKQTSDSVQIIANDLEPISFTAGLKYLDKYTDAETINIPVQSNAITLYNNQSVYADADSNYVLRFDTNTNGTVIFNNVIYERILQYIQDLKNYQYGCVEQTASKLKVLIFEEQINKKLQRKINVQAQIIKCVNKLVDMQNANGSYGWWRKGSADLRMTTYVLEALCLANKFGYTSTAMEDASSYLIKNLRTTKGVETLYPIYTLQKNGYMDVSGLSLKDITEQNISTTDKIYLYKIKQLQGQTIDNALWYSLMLELQNNARIRYCDNFFYDHKANIFNAYSIFKGTSIEKDFAEKFRTKITNGQLDKDLNTFSKASLIEAMLLDANENNNPVMAEITINDTLKVKAFPYTYTIADKAINIKHKGAPVWINTAEAYAIENPVMHDSVFNISTKFVQNNATVTQLKRGVVTQLQINIMAFKTKDYVMIEVPLPAGLIIKNKPVLPNTQDYIEYKNDKIIIYKTNMPIGNTNFVVDVQPIYAGEFKMPPAQIGMMYYPFVFGNNVKANITIE